MAQPAPTSQDTDKLARRLAAEVTGDVLFDRATRGRYATDASFYQMMPAGVVVPKTTDEALRTLSVARDEGFIVTPRGGGTSQCGQAVNSGIVVDLSKHLNRILSLDVEKRTCVVEPGIVLDDLNRQLRPHGLWFPVDVSTASRATIGGMAGNNSCGGRSLRYGTMRDNTIAMKAALADGTLLDLRQAFARGGAAQCRRAGARSVPRHVRTRRARGGRNRQALPEGAAAGRRLQSRCAGARRASEQPGAPAGRLGRHPRLHHGGRAETLACHPQSRARGLPLRQLLRGDGRDAAPRDAEADRGRAGRPHDDRARPRHCDVPLDHRDRGARRPGRTAAGGVRRRGPGRESAPPEATRRDDGRSRFWLGPAEEALGRRGRDHRAGPADQHRRFQSGRPQRHDVDEAGGKAGLLHRRLRGAAKASCRLHRAAEPHF